MKNECVRCGNCCRTFPCHLYIYTAGLMGELPKEPMKAPYKCPLLLELPSGTVCGLMLLHESQEEIGEKPPGWSTIVKRLILIGEGCTASDRIRRGELLK